MSFILRSNKQNTRHWLALGAVLLTNTLLFFKMNFISALEKTDKDAPLYTEQIQKLISGHPTEMMFPLFRTFVPALSMGVSAVFGFSYRYSMQLLSGAFLIALLVYIYKKFSHDKGLSFSLMALILSTPVIILYSWTYFLELPFFAFLLVSIWAWDNFCRDQNRRSFWVFFFTSLLGVLTKESYLVHGVILFGYTLIFYLDRYKKIMPYLIVTGLAVAAVYYLNYELFFGFKKALVINPVLSDAISTNLHPMSLQKISRYFLRGQGGFFHSLFNLFLALGFLHFLIIKIIIKHGEVKKYLMYFGTIFAFFVFITINVNAAQKYAFLCFGPSYFLFFSKNLPKLGNELQMGRWLKISYAFNLLLVIGYVFIKNSF